MNAAPSFIERDPSKITNDLIAEYEQLSGKTLYPAQVERLLINLIAYRETLVREAIQDAACQNLVNFARAPMLDELGALVACRRLEAQPARATFEAVLKAASATQTVLAANTQIKTKDGSLVFETAEDLIIPAGSLSGCVAGICTKPGLIGNGFICGGVGRFPASLDFLERFSNIDTTGGGSDIETDEGYRTRIKLAPETFSVAGSTGAYRYHALSAHPDIVDVAVTSPTAGDVIIYPLMKSGLPDAHILAAVESACSADKVRPLTDRVTVRSPEVVEYDIEASITRYHSTDRESCLAAVRQAAQSYHHIQASTLGRDIVPSQIIAMLSVPGVYRVDLRQPVSTQVVLAHQWPLCRSIIIDDEGACYG